MKDSCVKYYAAFDFSGVAWGISSSESEDPKTKCIIDGKENMGAYFKGGNNEDYFNLCLECLVVKEIDLNAYADIQCGDGGSDWFVEKSFVEFSIKEDAHKKIKEISSGDLDERSVMLIGIISHMVCGMFYGKGGVSTR